MITIRMNLRNTALTQYNNYLFNSFCMFNGRPLAANEDGIFTLDNDGDDLSSEGSIQISAWAEFPENQYGINSVKQGRRLYLGGEFFGNMYVKMDTPKDSNTYIINNGDNASQNVFNIPLKYNQRAEYWKITFGNLNGSDFSLDFIDGLFINVNRRLSV